MTAKTVRLELVSKPQQLTTYIYTDKTREDEPDTRHRPDGQDKI